MLSVTHTLISLPFAYYLSSPALIFCAAFVFHLLADTLLHWNIFPEDFKKYPFALVAVDVFSGVIAAWLITGDQFLTVQVIAAIAGGNAPDVLHGLWDLLSPGRQQKNPRVLRAWFVFHDKLQYETTNIVRGLVPQLLLVMLALSLLAAQQV